MRTTLPCLLVATALAAPWPAGGEPTSIVIHAAPVPLVAGDAAVDRIGRLRYRAGYHLTSANESFGGFSGLVIGPDGRLTAVSDQGHWLTAELRQDDAGTLLGLTAGHMGKLCDDDGSPVAGKARSDAEEIQALPEGGFLVSFEHHHRIVLYPQEGNGHPPLSAAPHPFPFPPAIVPTLPNKGMETLAVLADGRLLTFAEDLRTIEDDIIGWVGDPMAGEWHELVLRSREDFLPTGAATLPSGDVILLERSYRKERGNRVRLSLIETASLTPGARLEPRELALIEPPATVDNMEAVTVQRGPAGETLVYLMSDDNFSANQRTLLVQWELDSGFEARAKPE